MARWVSPISVSLILFLYARNLGGAVDFFIALVIGIRRA
jgi:hypothetical protein